MNSSKTTSKRSNKCKKYHPQYISADSCPFSSHMHHNKDHVVTTSTLTRDRRWILPTQIHFPASFQWDRKLNDPERFDLSPILLICGWAGAGSTDWGAIPSMFASTLNRCIITYDARWMGNSMNHTMEENEDPTLASLDIFAMDIFSIVDTYYSTLSERHLLQTVQNNNRITKRFSLVGVSMGGLLAQIVAKNIDRSQRNSSHNNLIFESGFFQCNTHSVQKESQQVHDKTPTHFFTIPLNQSKPSYDIDAMILLSTLGIHDSHHLQLLASSSYLHCFDSWSRTATEDSSFQKQRNRSCAELFFTAFGDDSMQRPGRIMFRNRLIDRFLHSRLHFVNHDVYQGTWIQRQAIDSFVRSYKNTKEDHHVLTPKKIFIIHGDSDRVIPLSGGIELFNYFNQQCHSSASCDSSPKNSKNHVSLLVLQKCDHMSWITHAHELVEGIKDFLQKE